MHPFVNEVFVNNVDRHLIDVLHCLKARFVFLHLHSLIRSEVKSNEQKQIVSSLYQCN